MSITRKEAEDIIDEIALDSSLSDDDIKRVRKSIPSDNPHITPLLEELSCTYFLTDEVLDYYADKLYQLAQK